MKHSSTDTFPSSPPPPPLDRSHQPHEPWDEGPGGWAGLRFLNWQARGRSSDPPRRPSTRTRATVQSWAAALSVKLRTNAACALSPSLLPSLTSFSLPLRKGQAEGGKDAVSLPSIWCCMPLSGCQPAHSNEGCHQGYCMLERCLLLLGSLSFFILFVQDTRLYLHNSNLPVHSFL